MTLQEAITLQPQWVQLWLYWLMIGAFILPLGLLYWKQTRWSAVFILISDVLAAFSTEWLFNTFGYVKLLGLPHIVLWTPIAIYLYLQLKRTDIPKYARWIMIVVLATITVSLAFDYTDVARYVLGNRGAAVGA